MLVWLIFFTYNAIRNPLVGNWGGLISLHGDFFSKSHLVISGMRQLLL